MDVGKRIRRIRNGKRMTQKELGEACGIAEPTIRRYELGMLKPRFSTLKKIADGLGVEVTELIDSDDPEEKYRFVARGDMTKAEEEAQSILNFAFCGFAAYNKPETTKETEKLGRLIVSYNKLDDNGKEKVIEYTEDLAENPRYQKKDGE